MKALYVGEYYNNDEPESYWFVGNQERDPEEQMIKDFKKENNYRLERDDIIDVWKVDDRDIVKVYTSFSKDYLKALNTIGR